MPQINCYICTRPDVPSKLPHLPPDNFVVVNCPTCGDYSVLTSDCWVLENLEKDRRYILSGVIRDARIQRAPPVLINRDNIDALAHPGRVPLTLGERLERIMRFLDSSIVHAYDRVTVVTDRDYPIAFARNPEEFRYMVTQLVESALITYEPQGAGTLVCSPTMSGWRRLDELRRRAPTEGSLCFVAMKYGREFDPAWEPGFRAGCADAGYEAIRLDKDPHNGVWIDWIMARIRQSRLVVADISEPTAGGVYFEAGFAMGLNIPVAFTCRQDRWDEGAVHANMKQFTVIKWKAPEDLRDQLCDRIEGTIGHSPRR